MDEFGYVTDLELAKKILIEFFTTGEYSGRDSWIYDENGYYKEFLNQIKNELYPYDEGFTFKRKEGGIHFGGPEGASGYYIQEASKCFEEIKRCPSVAGAVSDLNNENTVFYEVDGELKCFVLHELD